MLWHTAHSPQAGIARAGFVVQLHEVRFARNDTMTPEKSVLIHLSTLKSKNDC